MTAIVKNGNPVTESASSAATTNAGKQTKAMAASNKADGSRKPGISVNDANQRRIPVQKAWSGLNPITQRSNTPTFQNGVLTHNKTGQVSGRHENGAAEKISHQRLVLLLANAMGCDTSVTTKIGDIYSGIFFGASPNTGEPEYLLKMVQLVKRGDKADMNGLRENTYDYVGAGEDHAMRFKTRDIVDISFGGVSTTSPERRPNGTSASFLTDSDISTRSGGKGRELQPWVALEEAGGGQSLESSVSTGPWDQFQANENLFGVKSDYDENFYTTKIDKSHPLYQQRLAHASRVARTMGETSKGEADDGEGWDEEDKFSGVRREAVDYPPLQSTQPNRYQPPARRPPTGRPTVPGAPVDPAIISSSMARPEPNVGSDKGVKPGRKAADASQSSDKVTASGQQPQSSENESITKAPVKTESNKPPAGKAPAPNAAVNAEADALKAFRQFSEKQKIRVADDRRQRVIQDKNIKLNDLRSFSKNFKLKTLVPLDLVPILAKDSEKQAAILEKAQRSVSEQASAATSVVPKTTDDPASKHSEDLKRDIPKSSRETVDERSDASRQGAGLRGPPASLPLRERQIPTLPPNEQGLSQRLAKTQRDRQVGITPNVPPSLPIHTNQRTPSRPSTNAPRLTNSQGSNTLRTPTSATSGKFNVKAHEFVPNPAASSFMPTGQPSNTSSPRVQAKGRTASQISSPSEFFGNRRPLPAEERPSILDSFNPLKRLKEKAEKDGKTKDYAPNGGIAFAHSTPVTWTTLRDGEEGKSYKDMFDGSSLSIGPSPRPLTGSPMNSSIPHQHQLPPHLQHGPHGTPAMHTPPQTIYQLHPQQHLYPGMGQQFDDQRAHASHSGYSTSRIPNAYGAYPIPMGHSMQGPLPAGFPYPAMNGGNPQIINPGGPQPSQFRHFAHNPQYMPVPGQPLAAPMMVQQSSQGPHMPQGAPVGPIPIYAAGVPQYGPSQPSSGYPSPGRGAPMMHQGSFQGQNAQVHNSGGQYGQPFYSPQPPPHNIGQMRGYPSPQPQYSHSPQQQYHYPPQTHRMPSHGYSHHPQSQSQMSMQHPAHPGAAADGEVLK